MRGSDDESSVTCRLYFFIFYLIYFPGNDYEPY